MLRCLVASGTEPRPGARAVEAARLISLFLGDLCVVAMASEDRRMFGPFAVDSRNEKMTAMMRTAIHGANHERGAWPLAGRTLISGEPVVIDRIRPGELEGVVNPAMDGYLGRYGMSTPPRRMLCCSSRSCKRRSTPPSPIYLKRSAWPSSCGVTRS